MARVNVKINLVTFLLLRNYQVKRHKKSVAGQSVDKQTDVKEDQPRPLIKLDMDRYASKESEYVDEDLLRVEVSKIMGAK